MRKEGNKNIDAMAIINLVERDTEYRQLKRRMSVFNPFKVLKLSHYEIRHSNMLAWLISPVENHSLGDAVFKELIYSLYDQEAFKNKFERLLSAIHNNGLHDAEVYREFPVDSGAIDILVISNECKFALLIENKYHSKESTNQLNKYLDSLPNKQEFIKPDMDIIPVYLTLDGEESEENDDYFPVSYELIIKIIESTVEAHENQISDEIKRFINYYLSILKEEMNMDSEIKKLCKRIYQNNQDIIDKIYQIGNDFDFELIFDDFCEITSIEEYSKKSRILSFVPKELLFSKARMDAQWDRGNYAVALWFSLNTRQNTIDLVLEVGPFDSPEKRKQFLEKLNHSLSKKLVIKGDGGKYTRIWSNRQIKFDKWSSTEAILDKMNKLYENKELKCKIQMVSEAMKTFSW